MWAEEEKLGTVYGKRGRGGGERKGKMGEREDVRWTADKGKMEKKRKRQMIDGCVFVCLHESEREKGGR